MKLSVIIPAFNEERLLPACLDAIQASARALDLTHEIIVSDDGSTDATAQIAETAGARVIRGENRQIAATRNLGASIARFDRLPLLQAFVEGRENRLGFLCRLTMHIKHIAPAHNLNPQKAFDLGEVRIKRAAEINQEAIVGKFHVNRWAGRCGWWIKHSVGQSGLSDS